MLLYIVQCVSYIRALLLLQTIGLLPKTRFFFDWRLRIAFSETVWAMLAAALAAIAPLQMVTGPHHQQTLLVEVVIVWGKRRRCFQ
jgi:hypothetical protein